MKEELVMKMAAAMKKRAAEPLHNIPSLESVLVGSLGDAWPYLARACLSEIEAAGLVTVPRELPSHIVNDLVGRFDNDETYGQDYQVEGLWRDALAFLAAALADK